jgi:hypothetical protein
VADWTPLREEDISWKSPPVFNFNVNRRVVVERFGQPQVVKADLEGWGLYDAWCMRFACGLELTLCQFEVNTEGDGMRFVEGDEDSRNCQIYGTDRERGHLLFHLALPITKVHPWVPDNSHVGRADWRVMRQDYNGGVAEVAAVTSRCEAQAIATKFEERGHKQLYWVEQRPESA